MPTGIYAHKPCSELTKRRISDVKCLKLNIAPTQKPRRFCSHCGDYIDKKSRISWKQYEAMKFCSYKCGNEVKSIRYTGRKALEETKEKQRKALFGKYAGERSWKWRGGVTTLYRQIRTSSLMRRWREHILKRDNRTCQGCGTTDGAMQVDHIDSFAGILYNSNIKSYREVIECEKMWDTSNGRVLCVNCHRKTPNYGKLIINAQSCAV